MANQSIRHRSHFATPKHFRSPCKEAVSEGFLCQDSAQILEGISRYRRKLEKKKDFSSRSSLNPAPRSIVSSLRRNFDRKAEEEDDFERAREQKEKKREKRKTKVKQQVRVVERFAANLAERIEATAKVRPNKKL